MCTVVESVTSQLIDCDKVSERVFKQQLIATGLLYTQNSTTFGPDLCLCAEMGRADQSTDDDSEQLADVSKPVRECLAYWRHLPAPYSFLELIRSFRKRHNASF